MDDEKNITNEDELYDNSSDVDEIDDEYSEDDSEDFDEDSMDEESLDERPQHLGEEQFDRTLDDKDYYKNRDAELQENLVNAKEEAERDTMEIPPEDDQNNKDGKEQEDDLENKDNDDEKQSGSLEKNNDSDSHNNKKKSSQNSENSNKDSKQAKEDKSDKEIPVDNNKRDETTKDNKNKENNDDKKDDKSSDDREVVAVKQDGTKVVKKNEQDHKNDQQRIKNAEKSIKENKHDANMAKAYTALHPVEAVKKKIKMKIMMAIAQVLPYVLLGLGILALLVLFICLILGIILTILGEGSGTSAGYYEAPCQEITVLSVYDENTKTYSEGGVFTVDEYVAGVLASEVGNADNMEVYKAFAIAIRTYVYLTVDSSCSIENSTRKQTFSSTNNLNYINAAYETRGIVLTDKEGDLILTEYDSCHISGENDEFITLTQKNQQVDKSWYDSNKYKFVGGGHGRGMSQCGAYYLGSKQSTYQDILEYYYDDFIYKTSAVLVSVDGLGEYPLDSSDTVILRGKSLDELLKMSTSDGITSLDNRISSNVNSVGYATREGVVTAAVTLIGEVGKLGYRIPYLWGGGQGFDGVYNGARSYWGDKTTGNKLCYVTANERIYDLCGLDCAGFVNWAIYNGGYRSPGSGSNNYTSIGEVVSLKGDEAVLQPGDLLHTKGHIVLVVEIDNKNKQYIVAEASGYDNGVLFTKRPFKQNGFEGIKLDNFYNDDKNKRNKEG